MKLRIGSGIDFHQLVEGRDLWIGGIKIPHTKGALGHSDADVLLHAICDALLGAASLGDIGIHFPNTDEKYKGIDSKILLKETVILLEKKGYKIGNIDVTLLLEKPKISPYIPKMIAVLSSVMGIEQEDLSIKATTTETLGYEGREEGVSCMASALIYQI